MADQPAAEGPAKPEPYMLDMADFSGAGGEYKRTARDSLRVTPIPAEEWQVQHGVPIEAWIAAGMPEEGSAAFVELLAFYNSPDAPERPAPPPPDPRLERPVPRAGQTDQRLAAAVPATGATEEPSVEDALVAAMRAKVFSPPKTEIVSVPEWGFDVEVRVLDGWGLQLWSAMVRGPQMLGEIVPPTRIMTVAVVAAAFVPGTDHRLFKVDDVEVLETRDGMALARIFYAAESLNGLMREMAHGGRLIVGPDGTPRLVETASTTE